MSNTLTLKIVTPERIVLEESVDEISATAIDGEFAILPNHIPLVTALAYDVLRYKAKGEEGAAAVLGGILEVNNNTVTVLSDACELAVEIDEARARQAKERAEAEKLQRKDKVEIHAVELALARAMTRLKTADLLHRRHRGSHSDRIS